MDIDINIEYGLNTRIESVERENKRKPKNFDYIVENLEWDWNIETTNGNISFTSVGYSLYFRGEPVCMKKQEFNIDERGGYSFLEKRSDMPK